MEDKNTIAKAAESAADLFPEKYHCAESVVVACLEALDRKSPEAIVCASAFGGGFGRTFMETCGALSGSMIVIGYLYGRQCPGESWDMTAELGAAVRQKFLERQQTTNCSVLRERFGDDEQQQIGKCRELVRQSVTDLLDFLQSDLAQKIFALYAEPASNKASNRKRGDE